MRKVRWSQLGVPDAPRVIMVRGLGGVRVTQEDIERADRAGGDPEIVVERVFDDPQASYKLGEIEGAGTIGS